MTAAKAKLAVLAGKTAIVTMAAVFEANGISAWAAALAHPSAR